MLRSMHDLENYSIAAIDGEIGHVTDFLFDDKEWVIRYFIVETGSWLSSRKVLISPIGIRKTNWLDKLLPVSITQEQVKNSPNIDTNKTVTRQHEIDLLDYYSYPYYWGNGMYPHLLISGFGEPAHTKQETVDIEIMHKEAIIERHEKDDPNLRSCKNIIGYHIHATDGEIGHVSGILIEEFTMVVRYLVIDTTNWFGGTKVLISPESIKEINWLDKSVTIDLTCNKIKEAPEYHPDKELSRDDEIAFYKHYNFSSYWDVY